MLSYLLQKLELVAMAPVSITLDVTYQMALLRKLAVLGTQSMFSAVRHVSNCSWLYKIGGENNHLRKLDYIFVLLNGFF
jgi:hypothetical protein